MEIDNQAGWSGSGLGGEEIIGGWPENTRAGFLLTKSTRSRPCLGAVATKGRRQRQRNPAFQAVCYPLSG